MTDRSSSLTIDRIEPQSSEALARTSILLFVCFARLHTIRPRIRRLAVRGPPSVADSPVYSVLSKRCPSGLDGRPGLASPLVAACAKAATRYLAKNTIMK